MNGTVNRCTRLYKAVQVEHLLLAWVFALPFPILRVSAAYPMGECMLGLRTCAHVPSEET